MTTYIATPTEAAALHAGTQTVIVVPVKPQPSSSTIKMCYDVEDKDFFSWDGHNVKGSFKAPYQVGDIIAIREAWRPENMKNHDNYEIGVRYKADNRWILNTWSDVYLAWVNKKHDGWRSPATMPRSAVRTWQDVVAVECVRVRDMTEEQAEKLLQFDYSEGKQYKNYTECRVYHDSSYCFGDYRDSLESYIAAKHGQQAWDDNIYVFVNTVKKHIK